MKKLLLFFVALLCSSGFAIAQANYVASLQHGDSISYFYGGYAFQDAYNAADNGDIINLSGGSFSSTAINKAIIVRGTGIDDAYPTNIIGDFDINIPSAVTDRLSFEGCRILSTITVKGTLKNVYFLRDYLTRVDVAKSNADLVNGVFVNCQLYGMSLSGISSVQFVNSFVSSFQNISSQKANANFLNCVIKTRDNFGSEIRYSALTNCIIIYDYEFKADNFAISGTSSAINCLAINNSWAFEKLLNAVDCQSVETSVFQDSDMMKNLTDEAKNKFVGNDGTPVGMYGGILPYNTTPSYPTITKFNVFNKTTSDGKLKVEIKVSDAK